MNYYPILHSLRGFASVWVLLFHVWFHSGSEISFFSPFLNMGWVGVHMFYLLSAFLLGSICLDQRQKGRWDYSKFYKKRFLRIFPAYYFQLIILLIIAYFSTMYRFPDTASLISHFFIFFNLPPLFIQQLNGVWWTLPIEFAFYLILPFLVILIEKFGYKLFLFVSLIITICYRLLVFYNLENSAESTIAIYIGQLPGVFMIFSIGLTAAFILRRDNVKINQWVIISTVILLFIWSKLLYNNVSEYWNGSILLYIWESLNALFIMIIIAGIYKSHNKILCNKFFIWLGKISYGIYLWHLPIILVLKNYCTSFNSLLISTFIATIFLSSISYYFIEKRFTNLK